MPVAFLRPFGQGGFAPVARPRFILGRDLDCDLVDMAPGVADHHATVRLQRGEYVVVAENGCSLWVDGERVPLLSLRDRDTVALTPTATPWRFRSRVEGSFWPPEISVGEAWLAHPAYEETRTGPTRYGDGRAITGRDPDRSRMVLGPHGPLVIKYVGTLTDPPEATQFLRFLAALGGAVHPAVAPVVDGGITPRGGTPCCWIATRYVDGVRALDLVATGTLSASRALRILRSLAEGLAHLHHRGIVHAGVSLGNVVVPPTDLAILIDFRRAVSIENPVQPSFAAPPLREFAPPEVAIGGAAALEPPVDVYALGAVGAALLVDPANKVEWDPADVLAATSDAAGREHAAWLEALRETLADDPARRPKAVDLAASLRAAERSLGATQRS